MLDNIGELDDDSLGGLVEIERICRIIRFLLFVEHLVQSIDIGFSLGVFLLPLLHHVEDLGSFAYLLVLFGALSVRQGRSSLQIVMLWDLIRVKAVLADQLLSDILIDVSIALEAPASATLAHRSFLVAQIASMVGVISSERLLVDDMVDSVGVLLSRDSKPAKLLLVALAGPDARAHDQQHDEDDHTDADDDDSHCVVVIDFGSHFLLRDHVLRLSDWNDWFDKRLICVRVCVSVGVCSS